MTELPSSIGGETTETVGYFACDADVLARCVQAGLGEGWERMRPRWAVLADAVESLALSSVVTRRACIPVDGWTMLLTNGPLGTDVGALPSYVARELGCRAIRATCVGDDQLYPARILEVYGPAGDPESAFERSIAAANDGGRWVFETAGDPFGFEDTAAYTQRVKATRFTGAMLITYLTALDVPVGQQPDWEATQLLELREAR